MPFERSILNLKAVRLFCKLLKLPVHKVNIGDSNQIPRSTSDLALEQSDSFFVMGLACGAAKVKVVISNFNSCESIYKKYWSKN